MNIRSGSRVLWVAAVVVLAVLVAVWLGKAAPTSERATPAVAGGDVRPALDPATSSAERRGERDSQAVLDPQPVALGSGAEMLDALLSRIRSGDADASVALMNLIEVCEFLTYDAGLREAGVTGIYPEPEHGEPAYEFWHRLMASESARCEGYLLERYGTSYLRELAWENLVARAAEGHPLAVAMTLSGEGDGPGQMAERHEQAWRIAEETGDPLVFREAARAMLMAGADAADLIRIEEALAMARIDPGEHALLGPGHLPPTAFAADLLTCQVFGDCNLPANLLTDLCLRTHACYGDLPLTELLDGRLMAQKDFLRLSAFVANIRSQLGR
jgi:hypothetical protein